MRAPAHVPPASAELFDEGTTSCLPGEPRCHKMYVVRAFEVLFTWLQVDIFGGEAANRWGTFKKITVCGHSMGGSVSLLFAYLLKQTDNRLRALKPGQRMHVIGLSEFLEDPYLRCASPRYAAIVCHSPVCAAASPPQFLCSRVSPCHPNQPHVG